MTGINASFFYVLYALGQAFSEVWWIVLPVAFYYIFKILHRDFVFFWSENSFHRNLKWTYLEVIPSRNIERGPKLMESIFQGMSGVTSSPNTFEIWLTGRYTQDRFSLELVGEDGHAHFYLRIQKKYRDLIEAHIYAQYPDAEIKEVEDYTQNFPKMAPNKYWDVWGTDFQFTSSHPAFPIKTYDKFEEDITGTMIDPMASLMEVIGTLTPNQYIWLQYVIEPLEEKWGLEKEQRKIIDKLKGKEAAPAKGALGHLLDVILSLWQGLFAPVEFQKAEKKEEQPLEFRLTPVEKDILKAVEENLGKYTYRVKMRFIYIGRREGFNKSYVSSFIGGIKQFGDFNFNSLKPHDLSKTYGKIFFKEAIADYRKRKIYKRYRERNMDGIKVFLSSKELATVYHFPDMGVKSPAVLRVASKMGTAPPNLPVR